MSKKILLSVSLLMCSVFVSAPLSAATRSNVPMEMARAADPADEVRCLEAFINSEFDMAHSVCLPLAQSGLRDAQLVTGLMYALGEGVEQNRRLAKWWLSEAVRNGSEEAESALAQFELE
ncbi:hypothetical protein [Emcibacter sp.]|uniref:hypothetical protein n=1 Tax=Emcibacter sp. TaxID=1979954 RepID=UPI002AA68199|nr:hypothetical protein [Emcibacter sp.]